MQNDDGLKMAVPERPIAVIERLPSSIQHIYWREAKAGVIQKLAGPSVLVREGLIDGTLGIEE